MSFISGRCDPPSKRPRAFSGPGVAKYARVSGWELIDCSAVVCLKPGVHRRTRSINTINITQKVKQDRTHYTSIRLGVFRDD